MQRSPRWFDFRQRADFAPRKVDRHTTRGWEYIPIHPFADECELELGSECRKVDAWWGIDGDATLLESVVASQANRAPGLYFKQTSHDEEWTYLLAVIDAPQITRVDFEAAMEQFAQAGFPCEQPGPVDVWRPIAPCG